MAVSVMADSIILNDAPVAWLLSVDEGKGVVGKVHNLIADAAGRLLFNNTQDSGYKLKNPAAAAATEKLQINRGDGAVIEFAKQSLTIDGTTEAATGGSSSTVVNAEITFNTAQMDTDSVTWTAYLNKLKALIGKKFIAILPTGFTWNAQNATTPNAEGFIFQACVLSTDLDFKKAANTATPVTFTLTPTTLNLYTAAEDEDPMSEAELDTFFASDLNFLPTSIIVPGYDSMTINPPDVGATDGHLIASGEVVIKAAA